MLNLLNFFSYFCFQMIFMKNLILGLAAVLTSSVVLRAQDCKNLVSNVEFQQKLSQVSNRPHDEARLAVAKDFIEQHCLTSIQVKQMAAQFTADAYRLQFAKAAYTHTFDTKNYYDVLDAFKNFSAAFRLYHFIDSHQKNKQPDEPGTPLEPVYPPLNYPSPVYYKGPTGCGNPLADADFDLLIAPVIHIPMDQERMNAGRNIVKNNCISMAQFMKIGASLEQEANRLVFLKDNFLSVYDLENYTYAAALFNHIPNKNDWLNFAGARINPPPIPPCMIQVQELEQIKTTISNESTSSTKVTLTKQIISSKKCFRAEQIKELVMLMSFESGKLEIAKFAYDFCTDTENYYVVNDAFSFSSSKQELINYINGKK